MSTTKTIERIETEVQAAARQKGLTVGELAARMGVTIGYLSQIANGHRKWTPKMRAKVIAVLGEVPGQGKVHIRQESVDGESTYIRERARELGLTMRDVAARAGLSHSYVSEVSRGHRIMTVNARTRLEAALEGSVEVAPADARRCEHPGAVGPHERARHQPEQGRSAGGHHVGAPVEHHVRPEEAVADGAQEAARRAVPAIKGRAARDARRGQGRGLAQGRAQRHGRARERRKDRPHRRTPARRRERRIRLSYRL